MMKFFRWLLKPARKIPTSLPLFRVELPEHLVILKQLVMLLRATEQNTHTRRHSIFLCNILNDTLLPNNEHSAYVRNAIQKSLEHGIPGFMTTCETYLGLRPWCNSDHIDPFIRRRIEWLEELIAYNSLPGAPNNDHISGNTSPVTDTATQIPGHKAGY